MFTKSIRGDDTVMTSAQIQACHYPTCAICKHAHRRLDGKVVMKQDSTAIIAGITERLVTDYFLCSDCKDILSDEERQSNAVIIIPMSLSD